MKKKFNVQIKQQNVDIIDEKSNTKVTLTEKDGKWIKKIHED